MPKNIPDDTRDCDIDPPTCEQCSELEDKIEALNEKIEELEENIVERAAIIFIVADMLPVLEVMTRDHDAGPPHQVAWRKALAAAIAECRRLA
jgi:hypothetical protein